MRGFKGTLALALATMGTCANAQAGAEFAENASPFGATTVTNEDASAVEMPKLEFAASPEIAKDFDKYFYFHRADTDFATAYADVRECDGYARGLTSGIGYVQTPYPYMGTLGGAVGGVIGNAIAAAIFGSAEKRRVRRVNMRNCMSFKGYRRYGLEKELWQKFHFEEGFSDVEEQQRERCLRQQALVASRAQPSGEELGL